MEFSELNKMNKLVLLVFVVGLALVEPHFYIREPLSRTSIQTQLNRFPTAQQPFWWDHTGVWCGNQQQNLQYSTCGRCGDAPGNSHAAQGGRYDKGLITATYNAGQVSDNRMLPVVCFVFMLHDVFPKRSSTPSFQCMPTIVVTSNSSSAHKYLRLMLASATVWTFLVQTEELVKEIELAQEMINKMEHLVFVFNSQLMWDVPDVLFE